MPRWVISLLFVLLVGCSGATKVVRLDTGQGVPFVHLPRRDVEPVALDEAAFKGTGYAQWIDKKLNFFELFEGGPKMLEQARRQVDAANGTPIRWIVAEEKLAGALRKLFAARGLKIEVVHISPAR